MSLKGKTLFITGASRGIGKAIALRAARDGANIVIAAKTAEAHASLAGTIHTAAEEIIKAGGKALALQLDILVNNASAINVTNTVATPMKRFDLMFSVNVRGTFACTQAAIPYLKKSQNPHVLNLSPPLNMKAKWFKPHVAYTMSKYGMSMCVLGQAEEFRADGIAVNALWPKTLIDTAALRMLPGLDIRKARKVEIMGDAAHVILSKNSRECSGNFFVDEDILRAAGVSDFTSYLVDPAATDLSYDLFLD